MKISATLTKLKRLLRRSSFTAKEARSVGVHPRMLSYYAAIGYIRKLERGIYTGVDEKNKEVVPFEWEDLISVVRSIPKGVVCLISALCIYEMTDEIAREHWIAIPNKKYAPKRNGVRILRLRDATTGVICLALGDTEIKIFDRERTVVDSFRFLSRETAIKALHRYASGEHPLTGEQYKPDYNKLLQYGKKFRFDIGPYIEAMLI